MNALAQRHSDQTHRKEPKIYAKLKAVVEEQLQSVQSNTMRRA